MVCYKANKSLTPAEGREQGRRSHGMKVYFKSFFSAFTKGYATEKELSLPEGTTIADVLTEFGMDPEGDIIMLVNGRPLNEKTVLSDNDKLTIMPPVSAA